MVDYMDDDNDASPISTRISWQKEEMGGWSKIHRTDDGGKTTRCGQQVPEHFNADSWSQMPSCKACARASKKGA